jgi:hypothetical protein
MVTTLTVDTDGTSGDYSSLSAAVAAVPSTLDDDYVIECAASTGVADSSTVAISKTNGAYTLKIRAASGHEASTAWNASKYRIEVTGAWNIAFRPQSTTTVEGLQIRATNSNSTGIRVDANDCVIDSCFVRCGGDRAVFDRFGDTVAVNSIFVGGAVATYERATVGTTSYIYNCVISGGTYGLLINSSRFVYLKNCYVGNAATADISNSGTLYSTTSYTEDGSESTTTAAYSTSSGCYFTSVTADSEDFAIGSASSLKDNGTDLSDDGAYKFSDDIDGDTRSGSWDIGVDEYVASGVTVTPTNATLTITEYAPTVTATANVTATPGVVSLTLTEYAPSVSTPVVCTPGVAALTLAPQAPDVATSDSISVVPSVASLTLTAYAPSAVLGTTISITVPQLYSSDGGRAAEFNWAFTSSSGAAVRHGQYACGSYWVAPASGDSTLTLESLEGSDDPGQTDMVSLDADPLVGARGILDDTNAYGNYDSDRAIYGDIPIEFEPESDSCISLVAAMQRNEAEEPGGGTPAITGERVDAYCFVTLLPEPPADDGADSIRPNITGESKDFLDWTDFDLDRLPESSLFASLSSGDIEEIATRWRHSTEMWGLGQVAAYSKDLKPFSEGGRAFRASILHDEYASGMAQAFNNDLLSLFTNSNTATEKKPAIAAMLAFANDIWHARYDQPAGYTTAWACGAGQHMGCLIPSVLMATLMTDTTRADVVSSWPAIRWSLDSDDWVPQELQQIRRGRTGVVLWGSLHQFHAARTDLTTLHPIDRYYWNDLKKQGLYIGGTPEGTPQGNKSMADPYAYIDGSGNAPGYSGSYMVTTHGAFRGAAAVLIMSPEMLAVCNSTDVIEYAERVGRFGAWASPDPVGPPVGVDKGATCNAFTGSGCVDYGDTWGPDLTDLRYAIEDGSGRFSAGTYHGASVATNYESALVAANWSSIVALYDGDTYEDRVTDLDTAPTPDLYLVGGDTVYITHGHVAATIRYTTDDSEPDGTSAIYSGGIAVSVGDTVRAIAEVSGWDTSDVAELLVQTPGSPYCKPSTLSLALTGYAPTVTAVSDIEVTPDAASLTVTGYAPTVSTPVEATPGVASVTISTFAPEVEATANQTATPAVAELSLSTFSPSVSTPVTVTPDVASLTVTGYAPTVSTPVVCTPGIEALAISGFAPTITVTDDVTATPGVASLTLTPLVPTVTATDTQLATPSALSLTTATFAPTISATTNTTARPALAKLVLTSYAPSIESNAGSEVIEDGEWTGTATFQAGDQWYIVLEGAAVQDPSAVVVVQFRGVT